MIQSVLMGIKKFFFVTGCLMLWFMYAGLTLDKSPKGYEYTGNTGPMPSGYSIFLLGVLVALLMRRKVISGDKTISGILAKLVASVMITLGLWSQLSYDPFLSNLKNQPTESSIQEVSGDQLMSAVNFHRTSLGLQELKSEDTLCGNLDKRWEAVYYKTNKPTFIEWWASKNLKTDPFGLTKELYAVTNEGSDKAIQMWINSEHRSDLESPAYNSGCAYAAQGFAVLIMGEKMR